MMSWHHEQWCHDLIWCHDHSKLMIKITDKNRNEKSRNSDSRVQEITAESQKSFRLIWLTAENFVELEKPNFEIFRFDFYLLVLHVEWSWHHLWWSWHHRFYDDVMQPIYNPLTDVKVDKNRPQAHYGNLIMTKSHLILESDFFQYFSGFSRLPTWRDESTVSQETIRNGGAAVVTDDFWIPAAHRKSIILK